MLPNYLAERIRDTVVWYGELARLGDASAVIRTAELKPQYSFFEVFRMCQSVESIAKYQEAMVGDVCLRRNVMLRERKEGQTVSAPDTTGRILVLDTFSSTYDGLAADSSGGFFDEGDCPPWDLWVDYEIRAVGSSSSNVRGLLSAWIPEKFFEITEEAILVSGGEALHWGTEKHSGLDDATIGSFVKELERTVFAA